MFQLLVLKHYVVALVTFCCNSTKGLLIKGWIQIITWVGVMFVQSAKPL